MQIEQTTNDGLKRGFAVTIPASDIDGRVAAEVRKIAPQVRMPGFRPGKVPANLVRKMHGEQLHAQALNDMIRESVDKVMADNELRPAMQPAVALGDGYEQGRDATVTIDLEVLPKVEAPAIDGLAIERLTVPVSDEEVTEAIGRLAAGNKRYAEAEGRAAENGDQVVIDFVGRIDGDAFEGGAADDAALVLGSGTFIPGFEEQLVGVKAGDETTVTVTFPADYQADHLAGREAEFAVTVKAVKTEAEGGIDDELAKNFGLESLDKLKELMRGQLEQETAGLTRTQMKRALLDQLAAGHDFAVPQGMVDAEFQQIWAQLEQEAAKADDPDAARQEIESERDDYRRIAERRVRLGLLLSEIGQANNVQITQNEMGMLVEQAARQYRSEDQQRFRDYIQNEPMAAAQLRAPLYEDKVVDFLFDKASITERQVTREELEAAIEADDSAKAPEPAAERAKPARKATASKKADAAAADPAAPASEGGKDSATPAKPRKPRAAKPAAAKPADDGAPAAKPARKPSAKKGAAGDAAAVSADAAPAKKAKGKAKAKDGNA